MIVYRNQTFVTREYPQTTLDRIPAIVKTYEVLCAYWERTPEERT